MISFIVSCYGGTPELTACLATLETQGEELEIILTDNDPLMTQESEVGQVRIIPTGAQGCLDCYQSATLGASLSSSEWLCFPSHDSLYVQAFSKIMLKTAEETGAGLVYCDCVYRLGSEVNGWPAYSILETQPKLGRIDKTCFILKRELFKGFPAHPNNWCDGALIEELVKAGVKHAKAPGVLCVHQ